MNSANYPKIVQWYLPHSLVKHYSEDKRERVSVDQFLLFVSGESFFTIVADQRINFEHMTLKLAYESFEMKPSWTNSIRIMDDKICSLDVTP